MAEDAPSTPKPDDDAASGKIDYDFLNQIAEMFGLPAVSGAPVNQIARFLGFFVCFVCVLLSKDATSAALSRSHLRTSVRCPLRTHPIPIERDAQRTRTMFGVDDCRIED